MFPRLLKFLFITLLFASMNGYGALEGQSGETHISCEGAAIDRNDAQATQINLKIFSASSGGVVDIALIRSNSGGVPQTSYHPGIDIQSSNIEGFSVESKSLGINLELRRHDAGVLELGESPDLEGPKSEDKKAILSGQIGSLEVDALECSL